MSGWNVVAWYSIFFGVTAKSTLVLACAWLVARLLRGHSAAMRHLVWTAALAASLALPFLTVSLPAIRVRAASVLLPGTTDVAFQAAAAPSSETNAARSTVPGRILLPHTRTWPHIDWRAWLMLAWAVGFTFAFGRTVVAYAIAWRLRRSAKPFCGGAVKGTLSRALGVGRAVEVLETKAGSMPMTFGLWHSAILVPAEAAEWSTERQEIVLLHELAHVSRSDAATHLMARVALDIHWWNPLAWIAWREFLKERERAADDLVLNAGARPSAYAGHLLDVARSFEAAPAIDWAAVAMARRPQLEDRLFAILDSRVKRAAAGRGAVLAAALAAATLVAPLAAVRAQEAQSQSLPTDVDAAIRSAFVQKNYQALEDAAKAAIHLRKYETALKFLQCAGTIRGEVFGEQSVEYGVGLMQLAALKEKENPKQPATELYAKAAQAIGERPEAARALTQVGLAFLGKKDFSQAMDYLEHAQRVDPGQAGTALMWMAVIEEAAHKMDDAERLYQSALSMQDPQSPAAAVTMEVYGRFLRERGQMDQASQMEERAASLLRTNAPAPRAYPKADMPPSVLHKVEPEYSAEARAAKLQGTVVVQVVIGADGAGRDARIVRGLGLGLDEQALDAVDQWQFKPGTKGGLPVPVTATIEVNWRLL